MLDKPYGSEFGLSGNYTAPTFMEPSWSFAELVRIELERARMKHGNAPFHSLHEGYAIILEEIDELWAEIKQQSPQIARLRMEAIQAAAMLQRFVEDLGLL